MLYWNTVMLISFFLNGGKQVFLFLDNVKIEVFFHQYGKYKDNLFCDKHKSCPPNISNCTSVHLLWARWDHVTFCSYRVVNNVTCHFQMEALRTRVQCSRSFLTYFLWLLSYHSGRVSYYKDHVCCKVWKN